MAKKRLTVPLNFLPGLYTIETDAGAKNRWKNGDKVRWLQGKVEKIGGWNKTVSTAFTGVVRNTLDWISLTSSHLLALGSHLMLQVYSGGTFTNITPVRISGTEANPPFTTVNGSAIVTCNHVGHGMSVGDYATWAGATTFNNVTMNGTFAVLAVTDADHFTVTALTTANASSSGGGAAATYQYDIPVGSQNCTAALGFGAGTFGTSTYGTARASSALTALCRLWSMDNWGEDVIANPRDAGIYVWDTSVGTSARATVISGAPATAKAIIVSELDRHLIALGAHDGTFSDPLLIRWSDAEDYTQWTPSATNTSGRKRLDSGNEIYCGVKVGSEILVHTDQSFFSMVYTGPPFTFDFKSKGTNGALRSPIAIKEYDGRAFWMGENDFFNYDGRTRLLPCDVRNHVFDDINMDQRGKIYCGANRLFGELWWLYPSLSSTENDRYVLYSARENHWSFGVLARTVIVGDSKVFPPYACSPSGYLYNHEIGVDDDGSAMAASLDSWDFQLGDGEYVQRMTRVIPDFKRLTGSMVATLTGKIWPMQSTSTTKAAGTLTPTTPYLTPHFRARQVSINLATSAVGDDFRLGQLSIVIHPNGKK